MCSCGEELFGGKMRTCVVFQVLVTVGLVLGICDAFPSNEGEYYQLKFRS